ncbi:hypothetical protein [Flavobacterium sp.]|uniref:hypothetical protein n=1 Tax=Flavobacterium sp. TaxID=239 RepID=UPI00333E8CD9
MAEILKSAPKVGGKADLFFSVKNFRSFNTGVGLMPIWLKSYVIDYQRGGGKADFFSFLSLKMVFFDEKIILQSKMN